MAIYAFDGTCSEDKKRDEKDTNVIKFFNAYKSQYAKPDNCFYVEGVGTRYSILGLIAGGMMGAGGQQRIDEAFEALQKNFEDGDEEIDIIGFSRGSSLALEFANTINEQGVENLTEKMLNLKFAFLGCGIRLVLLEFQATTLILVIILRYRQKSKKHIKPLRLMKEDIPFLYLAWFNMQKMREKKDLFSKSGSAASTLT